MTTLIWFHPYGVLEAEPAQCTFVLLVASERTTLAILRLVSEGATSVRSYVLLFVKLSSVHFVSPTNKEQNLAN